jgi:hypothetical protein
MRLSLKLALFAGIAAALRAAPDPAMVDVDRAFALAISRGDKPALEKLLDPEFTWTDFHGKRVTRVEVLRDLPKSLIADQNGVQVREYGYGNIGDVQVNLGLAHVLRVWVKRPEGWRAIVYQEVKSLEAPPAFTPGAGKDCENPCKTVAYRPKNETEQEVIRAYSKLETAAMAHNSAVFATLVGDEFVAASSNSNKLSDKLGRMEDFDHAKMSGVAPTPLMTARLFDFEDAVLMVSEHKPDRGKPLHVTRLWVKRDGRWVELLSYQTSVELSSDLPGPRVP